MRNPSPRKVALRKPKRFDVDLDDRDTYDLLEMIDGHNLGVLEGNLNAEVGHLLSKVNPRKNNGWDIVRKLKPKVEAVIKKVVFKDLEDRDFNALDRSDAQDIIHIVEDPVYAEAGRYLVDLWSAFEDAFPDDRDVWEEVGDPKKGFPDRRASAKKVAHRYLIAGKTPKRVEVEWDFGDTDLEDMPYRKALKESGLPKIVKLPKWLLDEWEAEDEDDGLIDDWLSDEYGFTHFGWKVR